MESDSPLFLRPGDPANTNISSITAAFSPSEMVNQRWGVSLQNVHVPENSGVKQQHQRDSLLHMHPRHLVCVFWEQLSTPPPDWAHAGRQQEASVGSRGKSGFLCPTEHLEMSDGDLCLHTVLLCSWQPKGRWDESKAEAPRQSWQESALGVEIHTPQRVLTAPVRMSCPTKPMQMPDKDQQLHSKVQLGKAKGTGWIQHGTEEAVVQSDRLWELAQFVIHSVRC